MTGWLVALPLVVPMVAGVAALASRRRNAARTIARAGIAGLVASVAALAAHVWTSGPAEVHVGGWPAPHAITLVADGAAVLMLVVVALAALAAAIYRDDDAPAPVLFLVAGTAGAFLAGDLFNLYVWFEVTILASVAVMVSDRSRHDLPSLRPYVVVNLVASSLVLTAVGLLYGATGTVNFAAMSERFAALDPHLQTALAAVLVLGFAIKAGLFPLFSWMPRAYATLSPARLALFSALLTKVAAYAMLRILGGPLASAGAALEDVVLAAGCATMIAGVLCALAQMDLRRLLAFHIISQIGYLLVAVALMTPASALGFFFFVAHVACAKAALFLIAGVIARDSGTYDLRQLGGLAADRPRLALLFAAAALALAGLPPLSGFWAKLFVIQAAIDAGAWWTTGIALGVSLLTLLSMLKIWMYAFWRPAPGAAISRSRSLRPGLAAAVLVAATVACGLAPGPLHAAAETAAVHLISGGAP